MVRRLAAIDMHGTRGTVRRRRIILGEFITAAIGIPAFGLWLMTASPALGGRLLGGWIIGSGLNYLPLAGYAIALYRPGALEAELAGVDVHQELRRYGILQLWIFVPLSLAVLTLRGAWWSGRLR